jgi:CRISPR-associated protein Csx14
MNTASIPVDLFNPGQVFACLGFLEAADVLLGDAEGGFDWGGDDDSSFTLAATGGENPFHVVLAFLAEAKIDALSPLGGGLSDQWDIETYVDPDGIFPVSPKVSENSKRVWVKESALPIRLMQACASIQISHWADTDNGREPLKTWGGAAGKSGASRMRDLLTAASAIIRDDAKGASENPFNKPSPVGGFRLELRRDYVPMDIGFTLNAHQSTIAAQGFPMVEILAVIGLENARPEVLDRLHYRYSVWRGLLQPCLARPILGDGQSPFETRTFAAVLGEPNEYDRSILFAIEEHGT